MKDTKALELNLKLVLKLKKEKTHGMAQNKMVQPSTRIHQDRYRADGKKLRREDCKRKMWEIFHLLTCIEHK
jgi:hypothetical protein